MSTREIKEANDRLEAVRRYNANFNDYGAAETKARLEAFNLEKQIAQMNAEMNPSKIQRVKSFVDTAASAYESYDKINQMTGGALNKQIGGAFKPLFDGAAAANKMTAATNARTSGASKPGSGSKPSLGKLFKTKSKGKHAQGVPLKNPVLGTSGPFRIVPPSQQ